jgi:hypothetical protein
VDPRCLETEANEILTAIVHGMRRDEPSNHVKLAATNALLNSLEFTRGNFEKDAERHFIMQVVCEATQSEDVQVKQGQPSGINFFSHFHCKNSTGRYVPYPHLYYRYFTKNCLVFIYYELIAKSYDI